MAVFRTERRERLKEVPGYGGRYVVGDLGRVYTGGCEMSLIRGRFVNLCWKGESRRVDVAYLVARAFLSNLKACEWVRHKDGDLTNNRVENLEWVVNEPGRRGGRRREGCRAVMQFSLGGVYVDRYESLHEASERTGVARNLIKRCADGKAKRAKGWVFRYV